MDTNIQSTFANNTKPSANCETNTKSSVNKNHQGRKIAFSMTSVRRKVSQQNLFEEEEPTSKKRKISPKNEFKPLKKQALFLPSAADRRQLDNNNEKIKNSDNKTIAIDLDYLALDKSKNKSVNTLELLRILNIMHDKSVQELGEYSANDLLNIIKNFFDLNVFSPNSIIQLSEASGMTYTKKIDLLTNLIAAFVNRKDSHGTLSTYFKLLPFLNYNLHILTNIKLLHPICQLLQKIELEKTNILLCCSLLKVIINSIRMNNLHHISIPQNIRKTFDESIRRLYPTMVEQINDKIDIKKINITSSYLLKISDLFILALSNNNLICNILDISIIPNVTIKMLESFDYSFDFNQKSKTNIVRTIPKLLKISSFFNNKYQEIFNAVSKLNKILKTK